MLFMFRNACRGAAVRGPTTRSHLNEYQPMLVSEHQVNLAERTNELAGQNGQTLALQMLGG